MSKTPPPTSCRQITAHALSRMGRSARLVHPPVRVRTTARSSTASLHQRSLRRRSGRPRRRPSIMPTPHARDTSSGWQVARCDVAQRRLVRAHTAQLLQAPVPSVVLDRAARGQEIVTVVTTPGSADVVRREMRPGRRRHGLSLAIPGSGSTGRLADCFARGGYDVHSASTRFASAANAPSDTYTLIQLLAGI